jgi:PPM family protein phosphatase
MSNEEAAKSPMRQALWNVLGGVTDELAVEVYRLSLEPSDILLLCTDGLYGMVPDDQLRDVLVFSPTAESACRKLIDLANKNGGSDNITAIVARFHAPLLEEPRAVVEVEVPLAELTALAFEASQSTVDQ